MKKGLGMKIIYKIDTAKIATELFKIKRRARDIDAIKYAARCISLIEKYGYEDRGFLSPTRIKYIRFIGKIYARSEKQKLVRDSFYKLIDENSKELISIEEND